mmetsp:Transcript_118357/g.315000  ORF Transcript_118357/g.315000 Transcript_118357/m.315000 type:complete len:287 (-) Transcript_118357:97-957(-)
MQPLQHISEAERRFLLDGVAQGLRNDGRGCYDYRRISFETGPIPSATGSCRLRAGETDLLVGVKCDMTKPRPQRPDAGHFQISVECATSVSIALTEGWNAEDWGRQLSVLLESLCAGDSVIDRRALCVVPGLFAWEVSVDVLVLTSGGNLLDSLSLALCAALGETLLPNVEVSEAMEEGEVVQLTVDDRPEAGRAFPLRRLPLCVTVAQLQGRLLLDVTAEEELCADAMLCVVVDAKCGDVLGLHKLGRGLFDVASLPVMLERCKATAAALMQQLERELALKYDAF